LQSQRDQDLRRREAELAEAKQREQYLTARLNAQAETHQAAEQEWKTELEITRGTIEPLRALLVRTEKERDEARHSASEGIRQMQDLKRKSMEAFSLLNGWKNGNPVPGGRG
jgi:hypothetical protein